MFSHAAAVAARQAHVPIPDDAWEYQIRKSLNDAAYQGLEYVPYCTTMPVKANSEDVAFMWVRAAASSCEIGVHSRYSQDARSVAGRMSLHRETSGSALSTQHAAPAPLRSPLISYKSDDTGGAARRGRRLHTDISVC